MKNISITIIFRMLKWNQEQMRWKWFFIALAVLNFFVCCLVFCFFEGAQQSNAHRSNEFIVMMMITSGEESGEGKYLRKERRKQAYE